MKQLFRVIVLFNTIVFGATIDFHNFKFSNNGSLLFIKENSKKTP